VSYEERRLLKGALGEYVVGKVAIKACQKVCTPTSLKLGQDACLNIYQTIILLQIYVLGETISFCSLYFKI